VNKSFERMFLFVFAYVTMEVVGRSEVKHGTFSKTKHPGGKRQI